MGAASDGGYLGSDFEAFFSAVVSGAAGVYVGVLLQDAGIETDLVVRPGQRVSVSGDPSLPRLPRWGDGGFTVQQRSSLSLSSVEVVGAFSVMSGGSMSLAQVTMGHDQLFLGLRATTAGSVVRLSDVMLPDSWVQTEALTGSLSVRADGVAVYDPPNFLEASSLVRSPPPPPTTLCSQQPAQRR